MTGIDPTDLSPDDIEFLKSVRRFGDDADPDDSERDVEGSATTSMLIQNTSLTRGQVHYRMARPSDGRSSRGFVEAGLLRVYDGGVEPSGRPGPKSCDLTDAGQELLDRVEEELHRTVSPSGTTAAVTEERINDIEEAIERIDNQIVSLGDRITELTERVEQIEESEFGGVDSDKAGELDNALEYVIAHTNALEFILELDSDLFRRDTGSEITPDEIAEQRQRALAALQKSSEEEIAAAIKEIRGE